MPNPRRRHSKTRRDKRRTHDAITLPGLVECSHCHEKKQAHRVCPACGHYDGREVVKVEEA